ncbi:MULTISPECIES: LysE family translocator [unclassified Rathayibacter]|uniref:LysE family translocator n=1 Tax=unclassified Rathayibacter TaxID=2609250 RepID=UPI00188D5407|nr:MULTISPECIES: LysE family translocator [unclassified Rathayibacter]MBF4461278.1 LysE family translocator [Rathayibacter sp. VKM Ac-2879]MBF4502689.1 LysE family translocator [Rathayibacter sp. VKM Ac-2878]
MDPVLVAAFAGVALTLIAVPGPDWAFILAAGARDHVVIPAVAGLVIGYTLITGAVVVGVGPLVAAWPAALFVLTLLGAAYLIYLGVTILRSPGRISQTSDVNARRGSGAILVRGIGVSALNPKGLLIFLAILPQFTRPEASLPLAVQLAALGGVFTAICALFYLALGFAADRILGPSPRVARTTTRVAGATMILVGLVLIAERVIELVATRL